MTIKSHIAISATISLALIAIIACQQKPQASKEQSKAMTEQKTKVEEVMKNFEQEAKDETEKLETKVEQAAKEVFEEVKKSAKYGYENIKEGKFNNDLQGWLAYKDTPADNFNAVKEDNITFLRVENPEGVIYGVCQAVPVEAGAVYTLSAKVRSVKVDQENKTGARLAFFAPGEKEQQVLWSGKFKEWTPKEITFTNNYTGAATVYFHLGNAKSATSCEVTDISLKQVN